MLLTFCGSTWMLLVSFKFKLATGSHGEPLSYSSHIHMKFAIQVEDMRIKYSEYEASHSRRSGEFVISKWLDFAVCNFDIGSNDHKLFKDAINNSENGGRALPHMISTPRRYTSTLYDQPNNVLLILLCELWNTILNNISNGEQKKAIYNTPFGFFIPVTFTKTWTTDWGMAW